MSYSIIYKTECFKFTKEMTGHSDDLYVLAMLVGSNNTYSSKPSRRGWIEVRSRSWQVSSIGTQSDVLKEMCAWSADFEGGNCKVSGKKMLPEAFIVSMRNKMKKAQENVFEISDKKTGDFANFSLKLSLDTDDVNLINPILSEEERKTLLRIMDNYSENDDRYRMNLVNEEFSFGKKQAIKAFALSFKLFKLIKKQYAYNWYLADGTGVV